MADAQRRLDSSSQSLMGNSRAFPHSRADLASSAGTHRGFIGDLKILKISKKSHGDASTIYPGVQWISTC